LFPLRRLWFVSIIISCAGCELLFPLSPSAPVDVDAAVDAPLLPPSCPTDHSGPAFSSDLTKLLSDTCFPYSEAGGLALCMDFDTGPREGPVGSSMLTPSVLEPAPGAVFSAVLSPDGTQLVMVIVDELAPATIQVYLREGSGWILRSTSPSVNGAAVGIPSRGPDARLLVYDSSTQQLVELAQDSDFAWATLRNSSPSSLGLGPVNSLMNLSPDGHQLIYKRPDGIAYAYRASLADDFADATLLEAPAHLGAEWVFMTENCEQMFASFLTGGVFAAPQL